MPPATTPEPGSGQQPTTDLWPFNPNTNIADSGPSRTVIPTHCGQRSGDCGQFLMSV
jgi:hypothetical protein